MDVLKLSVTITFICALMTILSGLYIASNESRHRTAVKKGMTVIIFGMIILCVSIILLLAYTTTKDLS